MEYRKLGGTSLNVSTLSLGASPFGGVFRTVDEAECKKCLDTAIGLGINFIDVSPYYGATKAETMLGKCLQGVPRDKYILATKVGRYGTTSADFDFSAKRVTASVEESLKRMQVEHVDLIQCHDIEFGNLDQVVEETLPALRDLVRVGKARYVGITGLPLKVFQDVVSRANVDTILSYCHYSLNDSALLNLVPYLKEKGVGIINASPYSMGLLTDKGPPDWHPAPKAVVEACKRAAELCRQHGESISKLALQFSVANPNLDTTLVGVAKADHLKANVEWMSAPVNQGLLNEVRAILAPVHNITWPSGHPHNN